MSAKMTNRTDWVQCVENKTTQKKLLLGVMWYGET